MAGPKSMRGRELERVLFLFGVGLVGMRGREFLDCSNCFEKVWRRRMESCLSFKVWSRLFDKRGIREFLALSLREKSVKWVRNSDLCTRGKWRGKELLGCSSCLRKSRKRWGGACSLHGQVLVFGAYQHAWYIDITCVEFPLVACVDGISTITTHTSCLIKIPTMYVIT